MQRIRVWGAAAGVSGGKGKAYGGPNGSGETAGEGVLRPVARDEDAGLRPPARGMALPLLFLRETQCVTLELLQGQQITFLQCLRVLWFRDFRIIQLQGRQQPLSRGIGGGVGAGEQHLTCQARAQEKGQ
eukprot:gene3932-biopygen2769